MLNFIRDVAKELIDDMALNYGVSKAVDILLELKINDESIKQLLIKHFNLRYSEAENILKEAKEYRKK